MALKEIIQNINALQAEADALRPVAQDRLKVLNQKLRLEWNYHSNAIEGNTLTMSETRMLILHGFHTGNKLGRHYEEMKLHNDVLTTLEEIVRKNEPMTEVLIRGLHHQLMGDEYFVKAYDDLGNVVNVKGRPGEYKVKANGVNRIINGKEVFVPFKTPDEVRIEMPELIQWYRKEEEKKELHPVELAAIFHFRFVTLHPFDDGNGRISRLLMNMILMRAGYVPVIIRLEEREQYIYALAQAQDGESLEPFVEIVAKETERSLSLLIKAAKGESIDEPGDLDKQIELLKMKLDRKDLFSKSKDKESIERTINEAVFPLLKLFEQKCAKLQDLFVQYDRTVTLALRGGNLGLGSNESDLDSIKANLLHHLSTVDVTGITSIDYNYSLKGFKKSLTQQYMAAYINVTFNEFNYTIRLNNDHQKQLIYSYDTIFEENEINRVVKILVDYILSQIKNASGLEQ
jgi:Fic family protein